MTHRSNTRSRARTRSEIRTRTRATTTRRLSPCHRHPDEPATGICPACLRERLSGLDTSIPSSDAPPELRRSRSVVAVAKCEASSSRIEPRRNSCDVVSARNSLSELFDVDDVKAGSDVDAKVETKNLGLSRVSYTVVESEIGSKGRDEGIRDCRGKLGVLEADCVESDEEGVEGEFRTMKEYIDLEFQNKSKKSKESKGIGGSLASVFSKTLRKWGQKNSSSRVKKLGSSSSNENGVDGCNRNGKLFDEGRKSEVSHSEYVGRRRSCDMEPRFSVDGGRVSFEEPRASWDGYMIARTIPRLAPMFSVVENGILGSVNRFENHRLSVDGPMHAIMEDDSSSGGSGNFHSDSSSSMRGGSSFDRSSSVRSAGKKVLGSEDHGLSPANVKLVITEKELKDWHLSAGKGENLEKIKSLSRDGAPVSASNSIVPARKSVRWRKMCNVFGIKPKISESKPEASKGNVKDPLNDDITEKEGKEVVGDLKDISNWKLTRCSSVVGPRTSSETVGSNYRRRSVDNAGLWAFKKEELTPANGALVELEGGTLPFYMTPLRSLRRSKSGKFKLHTSHSLGGNVLQLN